MDLCLYVRLKDDFSPAEWANKEDAHCKACIPRGNKTEHPIVALFFASGLLLRISLFRYRDTEVNDANARRVQRNKPAHV